MAKAVSKPDDVIFQLRMARSAPDLWPMLETLYGKHPLYLRFCTELHVALKQAWKDRPADLKLLDLKRDLEPDWFQRSDMAGYVFYIDRFAKDLQDLPSKLGYLEELGISYVHFMPCLKPRPGDSDGGYSVMDYRSINPAYGTLEDFKAVATELRHRGISLCIDLVCNHTAKEHDWAIKAAAGDAAYQDMYLMFDSPDMPQAYEKTLVEVFPDNAPGNFTHYPAFGKWVWTTFNEHQWDLNWANPLVFLEITKIMLHLANCGVDVLRLDAVAFMWKRLGTRCQSEPEVHMILQALRACSRIAAPAVIHLEEAIVSPQEMLPYLGRGRHDGREGNLAYHNSLMVQFWGALATRDARLMTHVLASHFPDRLTNATYATYIRCHDDIGWAITDEDAAALNLSGPAHRSYLSDFYEGSFPGSFAQGEPFQVNAATGDMRISGSFASLAGLEKARGSEQQQAALQRMLLGHALIACFGGIPLIYMGDELALLNDASYRDRADHAHDSRWLHRPVMDWARAEQRNQRESVPGKAFGGLQHILARRRATPGLHAGHPTRILTTGHDAVFAVQRLDPRGPILCLFNFAEEWRHIPGAWLRDQGVTLWHDALSDRAVALHDDHLALPPFARVWLT